jgi:hypothetical protein
MAVDRLLTDAGLCALQSHPARDLLWRPARLQPVLDCRLERLVAHELSIAHAPVGCLQLRRHREVAHNLGEIAVLEVIAPELPEDRAPMPAQNPRHLVRGDLRRPPALDLPPFFDAQLRVFQTHFSTPSNRQVIVSERKS